MTWHAIHYNAINPIHMIQCFIEKLGGKEHIILLNI